MISTRLTNETKLKNEIKTITLCRIHEDMQWREHTSDRHPRVARDVGQRLCRGLRAGGAHGVHRGSRGGRCGWGSRLVVELRRRRHAGRGRRHRRATVVLRQRVVHHGVGAHCRWVPAALVIRADAGEGHRSAELLVVRHVGVHPGGRAGRCRRRGWGALRAAGARRARAQRRGARERRRQRRRQRRWQRRWQRRRQRRLYRRRPRTRE